MNRAVELPQHYPIDAGQVPRSWVCAYIGEVAEEVRSGFASGKHNKEGKGVPHLRPMNVNRRGEIDLGEVKYVSPDRGEARLARGEVLFNNTNSPDLVGKTAYFDRAGEWAFSNHMTRLQVPLGVSGRFVAYQLHYLWMTGFFHDLCTKHVNQASVAAKTLAQAVPLVLAPEAEQLRIVDALDELFSRLDAGVVSLERAQRNLGRMRAAVFQAAVEGHLVPQDNHDEPGNLLVKRIAEDRGFPFEAERWSEALDFPLPTEWGAAPLGVLAKTGSGGTPSRKHPQYFEGGQIPWVKSGELGDSEVRETSESITELGLEHSSAQLLGEGTLLMAMYGATVGKLGILGFSQAATNQAVCSIEPVTIGMRDFLWLVLRAARPKLIAAGQGGAQPNISQAILRNFVVPVPPMEEQARIVREVDRQLSLIQIMEQAVEGGLGRGERLRRSLLSTAFEGKLVPQDPSDEPAHVLLDRIAAAREAAPEPRRRRRYA